MRTFVIGLLVGLSLASLLFSYPLLAGPCDYQNPFVGSPDIPTTQNLPTMWQRVGPNPPMPETPAFYYSQPDSLR
jgi:hypothetical protein